MKKFYDLIIQKFILILICSILCISAISIFTIHQRILPKINQLAKNHINTQVIKVNDKVNKVGAGAAALAALHPLDFDPDNKWDIAAGYGNYRGANAAALGAYYRPNEDMMWSIGASIGGGENMVNAGLSMKVGSGTPNRAAKVNMAKEIKELRQQVAKQDAQIEELKALVAQIMDKK